LKNGPGETIAGAVCFPSAWTGPQGTLTVAATPALSFIAAALRVPVRRSWGAGLGALRRGRRCRRRPRRSGQNHCLPPADRLSVRQMPRPARPRSRPCARKHP